MKLFNHSLQMSVAFTSMLLFTSLSAQNLSYSDSWAKAGLFVSSETQGDISLNYSITIFSLQEQDVDGCPTATIALSGNVLPDYGLNAPSVDDLFPASGMAAGKYFLQQSDWPYSTNIKAVAYNLFHYIGGAFQRVDVPQILTMTHDAGLFTGVTTVNVSANAGTRIANTLDDPIRFFMTQTMCLPKYKLNFLLNFIINQIFYV